MTIQTQSQLILKCSFITKPERGVSVTKSAPREMSGGNARDAKTWTDCHTKIRCRKDDVGCSPAHPFMGSYARERML